VDKAKRGNVQVTPVMFISIGKKQSHNTSSRGKTLHKLCTEKVAILFFFYQLRCALKLPFPRMYESHFF